MAENEKSPAREEVRQALKIDRQLGGGVLPILSKLHWEEECAASMSYMYLHSLALATAIAAMQQLHKRIATIRSKCC